MTGRDGSAFLSTFDVYLVVSALALVLGFGILGWLTDPSL